MVEPQTQRHTHSLVTADFQTLMHAAPTSEDRLQIKRIFQGNGATIIRLSLAPGQIMREHSTNSPLIVQVLEGTVLFRISGEELELPTGAVLHVEPTILHEVEAMTEAHMLLTLTFAPTPSH